MSRCPKCGEILPDKWLKSQGASLLGKASGECKRRSKAVYQKAAKAHWRTKPGERKGVRVDLVFPDEPKT